MSTPIYDQLVTETGYQLPTPLARMGREFGVSMRNAGQSFGAFALAMRLVGTQAPHVRGRFRIACIREGLPVR